MESQINLWPGGTLAYDQFCQIRYFQMSRAGASEQRRLIISALLLAQRMEWQRNNPIRAQAIMLKRPGQEQSQRFCQPSLTPVLQSMNSVA